MWTPELLEDAAHAGLHVTLGDGIARLVLSREGGNRFSNALIESWTRVVEALATLPDLRAVLLTADGPDFSFGADLADADMAHRVAGSREDRMVLAELGQRAVDSWATLPVPTVAAARGRIIGAGACFFSTADFPCAHPEATVQFPEVDRGMHLSWGIVPRLAARYGLPWATTLAMAGERVSCRDLPRPPLRLGDEPLTLAEDQVRTLASKPPLAVRAIKAVLGETEARLQGAGARDPQRFADTVGSADFAEAMAAWFEKRPGRFGGK